MSKMHILFWFWTDWTDWMLEIFDGCLKWNDELYTMQVFEQVDANKINKSILTSDMCKGNDSHRTNWTPWHCTFTMCQTGCWCIEMHSDHDKHQFRHPTEAHATNQIKPSIAPWIRNCQYLLSYNYSYYVHPTDVMCIYTFIRQTNKQLLMHIKRADPNKQCALEPLICDILTDLVP